MKQTDSAIRLRSSMGLPEPRTPSMVTLTAPVFNEIACVRELCERLSAVGSSLGKPYEIVLVDDGSSDGTREALIEIARTDPHFRIVALSRNFGLQASVHACLVHARGDVVAILDGDLQDPPELIPELLALWKQGFDIVYTVKLSRKDAALRKFLFSSFYFVQKMLVCNGIPPQAGNFSVLDKRVVRVLAASDESNRYFPGQRHWCGFRQTAYHYHRDERHGGKPKMSFFKLLKLGLDGIFNYTRIPLQLAYLVGAAMIALSGGLVGVVLYKKFITHTAILGWTSTIMIISLIGGAQLMSIGVLGEYIYRIFANTTHRPGFVVEAVYTSEEK